MESGGVATPALVLRIEVRKQGRKPSGDFRTKLLGAGLEKRKPCVNVKNALDGQ